MLYAYFDESGTHGPSKVTMVAGLVGTIDQWTALQVDWLDLLRNLNLQYFHAVDCSEGNDHYSSLDWHLRNDLFANLAQLFTNHKFAGVNGIVWRSNWNTFKKGPHGQRFPEPYYLCFQYCVESLAQWSVKHANGEPISIIFSDQQEYSKRARKTFEIIKAKSPWKDFLGTLTFAPANDYPALQAADLFAYEFYRYLVGRREDPKLETRRAFQKFLDDRMMILGGFLPLEEINANLTQLAARQTIAYNLPPIGIRRRKL